MIIQRIAEEFGISSTVVSKVVSTAPHRYKTYSVKKKSGSGERLIAQPAKEIKIIQRYIVKDVIDKLPIHDAAGAYRKKRNIKWNAEGHANNRYLLKMDFRNFFPSLRPEHLIQHIIRHMPEKFDEEDLKAITQLCFWKPHKKHYLQLSIGGPSSPFISNTLMYDFDNEVSQISANNEVKYTRYADDLTFSTNKPHTLKNIEKEVIRIVSTLEYPKVSINADKTIHTSKKHHRRVTGLILSSQGNVSLGRKRKREISVMVHHAINGMLDTGRNEHLKGLLAFSHDVEPDFVERLEQKYGKKEVSSLYRSN